ncbi:MAG: biotin-dependent carboxyltransferase family protein [Alphaproteobacteria bacterium]|nr:biotin-dependent carboxyltransferase family protein [Alphaproteobacteria bacterium]
MSVLRCVDPGPLATVQDRGRIGWQRFGVSVAGAMDPVGLALANLLVGNPPDAAAVEVTLSGGVWEVEADSARLAFAGADIASSIDGRPAASHRAHTLKRGQRLTIGALVGSARGYLSVAGGFRLVPVLGSISTHLRSKIGGADGGPLRSGQELPLVRDTAPSDADLAFDASLLPSPPPRYRAIPGPQDDAFTREGIETLFAAVYTVTTEADRMGMRLAGPKIAHAGGYNIISDGIAPGSIQVPGAGLPIVLFADRQTTGGYPKIATVVSADLGFLARCRPGDQIRFERTDLAGAARLRKDLADRLARLAASLFPARLPAALDSATLLAHNLVDGVTDGLAPP